MSWPMYTLQSCLSARMRRYDLVHPVSDLRFTEYLDGPEQGHSPSELGTFDINFNLLLVKPTAGKTCFTETPTNKPIETQEQN